MAGVKVEIQGADEALAALSRAVTRIDDPIGLYRNIGEALLKSTQHRFETARASDGNPWPPSIRALVEGGQTLVNSGQLLASLHYNASASGLELGTNKEYAAIHQFGGTIAQGARSQVVHFKVHKRTGKQLKGFRKEKGASLAQKVAIGARTITIPARPFLGLDDDDEREITRIAGDWLADALGGLGDGQG